VKPSYGRQAISWWLAVNNLKIAFPTLSTGWHAKTVLMEFSGLNNLEIINVQKHNDQ